jgi:hypothetical protein
MCHIAARQYAAQVGKLVAMYYQFVLRKRLKYLASQLN